MSQFAIVIIIATTIVNDVGIVVWWTLAALQHSASIVCSISFFTYYNQCF